jgi:hypothetical protein
MNDVLGVGAGQFVICLSGAGDVAELLERDTGGGVVGLGGFFAGLLLVICK